MSGERSSLFPVGYEGAWLHPTKYLRFEQVERPGKKTSVWNVVSQSSGMILGTIRWHGPWRQYTFWPGPQTLYNTDCLVAICEAIETLHRFHRNIRANLAAAGASA